MKYNPRIHHRHSIRLQGHDYSQEGAYFITICTHERKYFFGEIAFGKMILNGIGVIADQYLREIPGHFPNVEMGEFVVMPNHVHCILIVGQPVGSRHVVGPRHVVTQRMATINEFSKPIPGSVSVIIQQYKSSVKRWCNNNNHNYFKWQSRFYDHIIRDDRAFHAISNYIKNNPVKWKKNDFY